jgi:DNA-directed RNA polymerase alpha subunit
MRRSGMTLREIGERLGASASRAGQLVHNAVRDETCRLSPTSPVEARITASTKIGDLPWSWRTYNVLRNCGFDTVGDLLCSDRAEFEREMLRVPNCNRRSWEEIASILDRIESD